MIIHVVQQGDTIYSIAKNYGVSETRLAQDNEIVDPNHLVIGETLVILYPDQTYIVKEGDTLESIAKQFEVSVLDLLRNNPYLSDRDYLYIGETIIISYEEKKKGKFATNGYAYPYIDRSILKKTLPYLTYLTIYSYLVTQDGDIKDIDDAEVINLAKAYGVAPIMMVVPLSNDSSEEIGVTHTIIQDPVKQDVMIENILILLKQHGFYGVNVKTPYILPSDREPFVEFIAKLSSRVRSEGFKLFTTLNISVFDIMTSALYEGLSYKNLSEVVDGIIFLSFTLGYSVGLPAGIIPTESISNFLDYLVTNTSTNKYFISMPVIAYLWKLPYEVGTSRGQSMSYNSAIGLARENNQEIHYDNITQTAFFTFISDSEYLVRFKDARSVDAMANLVAKYSISGLAIWNIMFYFPQMWLVINSQYEIEKVL